MFVVHPRRTRLHDVAEHVLCRPGEEASVLARVAAAPDDDPELGALAAALRAAGEDAIVIAGPRLADTAPGAGTAAALARQVGAGFASVSRRANDHGALRAGIAPGLYPGGRTREEMAAIWGPDLPATGRDAGAILEACANHEIDVLVLVGVDPLRDFPDAALARRALENVPFAAVQDLQLGDLENYVDVFLPAAAFLEKDGHFTTWEGRGQRLRPVRAAPGIARADWEIFAGLARAMGGDLGFETLDELRSELGDLLAPREVAGFDFPTGEAAAPATAEGELQLFSYPLLVDEGLLSAGAVELKAALEEPAFCEVNTADAERAGVVDGSDVIVRTAAGEARLPARVTPHVASGAVFVPFNQPGCAANTLLSGAFTTSATLEAPPATPSAEAGADAAEGASPSRVEPSTVTGETP